MKSIPALSVLAAFAGLAPAQFGSNANLQDGTLVYVQGTVSSFSNNFVIADLLTAGPGSTDHLVGWWWWYRIAGDGQEWTFRNDGFAAASRTVLPFGSFFTPYTGRQIVTTWNNLGGRNLLRAELLTDAFSTGGSSGVVVQRMTLTNIDNAPVTLDLWSWMDADVCGTFAGDTATGDGSRHRIVDTACSTVLEFVGIGNDRTEVAPFPVIHQRLSNTLPDGDLLGWSGTFGPGDYQGAFQWQSRTLTAGQSETFVCYLTVNEDLQDLPQQKFFGQGGVGGNGFAPYVSRSGAPVQNSLMATPFSVTLDRAAASSPCVLLTGFAPGMTVVAGIDVLVDLNGLVTEFSVTDSGGSASRVLTIPTSPALSGLPLANQWLVMDPGAANGLASWTPGMSMVLGRR